ncbi:MAG: hypothetical protein ACLVEJ_10140 [Parabacteroides sp.]
MKTPSIIVRNERLNEDGQRERFKVNGKGEYLLKDGGTYNPADGFRLIPRDSLIPDRKGDYFRQWRPEIKNTDDIWQQIVNVTHLPGLTSAPKLQPIEARLVMLSTGMRAPMGLKIYGPDLETIEQSGKAIEQALKEVPSVIPSSVFYDRAVGAPYLEIKLNRDNMFYMSVKRRRLTRDIECSCRWNGIDHYGRRQGTFPGPSPLCT